jgi:hypothetical protein
MNDRLAREHADVAAFTRSYLGAPREEKEALLANFIARKSRRARYEQGDTVDMHEVRRIAKAADSAIREVSNRMATASGDVERAATELFIGEMPNRYINGEQSFKNIAKARMTLRENRFERMAASFEKELGRSVYKIYKALHETFNDHMQRRGMDDEPAQRAPRRFSGRGGAGRGGV